MTTQQPMMIFNVSEDTKSGAPIQSAIYEYTEMRGAASPEDLAVIDHKLGVYVGPMMIHYNLGITACAQVAAAGMPKELIANYFDQCVGYGWVMSSLNLIPAHILIAAIDSANIDEAQRNILLEQISAEVAPVNFILNHFLIMVEAARKEMVRSIIGEFFIHMKELVQK